MSFYLSNKDYKEMIGIISGDTGSKKGNGASTTYLDTELTAQEPKKQQGIVADTVDAVQMGAWKGVSDIAHGVGALTGADWLHDVGDWAAKGADENVASMSDEMKAALNQNAFDGEGQGVRNLRWWAGNLGSLIGQNLDTALTLGAGKIATIGAKQAGKLLLKKEVAEEVGKTAVEQAAKRGIPQKYWNMVGITATMSAMSGGGRYGQKRDEVMGMTNEQLAQIPQFSDEYYSIADSDEGKGKNTDELYTMAKKSFADKVGRDAALNPTAIATDLVTNAVSGLGGGFWGLGSPAKTIKGGLLKGAAVEGGTEAIQGIGEQYALNKADQKYFNPDKDLTDGMADNAINGAVLGAVFGSAMGGLDTHTDRIAFNNQKRTILNHINTGNDAVDSQLRNYVDMLNHGATELGDLVSASRVQALNNAGIATAKARQAAEEALAEQQAKAKFESDFFDEEQPQQETTSTFKVDPNLERALELHSILGQFRKNDLSRANEFIDTPTIFADEQARKDYVIGRAFDEVRNIAQSYGIDPKDGKAMRHWLEDYAEKAKEYTSDDQQYNSSSNQQDSENLNGQPYNISKQTSEEVSSLKEPNKPIDFNLGAATKDLSMQPDINLGYNSTLARQNSNLVESDLNQPLSNQQSTEYDGINPVSNGLLSTRMNQSQLGRQLTVDSSLGDLNSITKDINADNQIQKDSNSDFRLSLNESADSDFAKAVDTTIQGGKPSRQYIPMGTTPDALKMLGLPDTKVLVSRDVLKKVMLDKHNVTAETLKQLPKQINHPIAIMKSAPQATHDGYVVLTELLEKNISTGSDEPIISALHLKNTKDGLEVINIASVYGKNLAGLQNMLNNDLAYWNKTKGSQFIESFGLQLPSKIDSKMMSQSFDNIKTEADLSQYQTSKNDQASKFNPEVQSAQEILNQTFGKAAEHIEVATFANPPKDVRHLITSDVEGWFNPKTGKVTLIADSIKATKTMSKEERLQFVAWHEMAHRGINVGYKGSYDSLMQEVGKNKAISQIANAIQAQRKNTDDLAATNRAVAIEEAIAEMMAAHETGKWNELESRYGVEIKKGQRQSTKSWLAMTAQRIKDFLAKFFGAGRAAQFSDEDVLNLIARVKEKAIGKYTEISSVDNGVRYSIYHRRNNNSDSPDNGVGYSMFAEDEHSVEHYGNNHWILPEGNNEKRIYAGSSEFKNVLNGWLNDNKPLLESEFGRSDEEFIDSLIEEANPDDIVDSAGFWDNEKLVRYFSEEVLAPNGWEIVETRDGAISFNDELSINADSADNLRFSRNEELTEERYNQAKSNGETELTFKQWQQVRSPEFKAWFGDWENDPENASKVVNPKTGEPLVVYHGTLNSFNVFSNDRGIHFVSDDPKFVDKFVTQNGGDFADGANVMPLFISSKNPFDYTNKKQVGKLSVRAGLSSSAVSEIKKGKWQRIEDRTIIESIKELGFDGFYVNEDGVKNLAIFNSNQIKSASSNTGGFSSENDDIRFSRTNTDQSALDLAMTGVADSEPSAWDSLKSKDFSGFKERFNRAMGKVDEWLADSLRPVNDWIDSMHLEDQTGNTSSRDHEKRRLKDAMYVAKGKRDAINSELEQAYLKPILSKIAALSKQSQNKSHPIDELTMKRMVGNWISARYSIEKNIDLLNRDEKVMRDTKRLLDNAKQNGTSAEVRRLNEAYLKAKAQYDNRKADIYNTDYKNKGNRFKVGVAGGWSIPEAELIMSNTEKHISRSNLEYVADLVYDLNQSRLDVDRASGRYTEAEYQEYKANRHYVPLTGDPNADADVDIISGAGSNALNIARDKTLKGRTSSEAEDAIDAVWKSIGKSTTYAGFAEFKSRIDDLFETEVTLLKDKGYSDAEAREQATANLGISKRKMQGLTRSSDNVLIRKEGSDYYEYELPTQVMESLRNDNVEHANAFLKVISKPTGWYARGVTQWTVTFAPMNMMRDTWEKSEFIRVQKLYDKNNRLVDSKTMDKIGRDTIKNAFTDKEVWQATKRLGFGQELRDSVPVERMLKQLLKEGGVSNYGTYLDKSEVDLVKRLRKENNPLAGKLEKVGKVFEGYNKMFDTVSALASYKALVENGIDSKQAAATTLELTNFRKTGSKMRGIKALYMFSQPTVMGAANLMHYLSTRKGQIRFAAYMAAMISLYTVLRSMDDEDEGGNKMDQLGDITRYIPIPLGGGKYFKIPVGFGMAQMAWNFSTNIVKGAVGDISLTEAGANMLVHSLKTFSPVSPSEISAAKYPMEKITLTATPSILQPVMQNVLNRSAFGNKITTNYVRDDKLKAEQSKATTAQFWKDTAIELNDTLGIDMHPEQIKNLFDGYSSMLGSLKELNTIFVENPNREDLGRKTRTPFLNQFIGTTNEFAIQSRYYEASDEAKSVYNEYKSRKERNELGDWLDADKMKLIKFHEEEESVIKSARSEKAKLTRALRSGKISAVAYESGIKRYNKEMSGVQARLLRKYRQMEGLNTH
ncbi:LPD38 domain-containing protein [Haemophilus parainfluenzae]|uniref:MuF-C-terminal domain-containing protein n=1 Tax=Haemophilus parainfluenzae TaxID=729 RepID=UPI000DAD5EF8|nr:LPD38 domain-containing protein [Haemophilus parainfluenzae]RDE78300.1 hypothetical protein DPV94_00500 [Haemophilus parainfluenzae]DAX78728.1 MAG TPA: RNA polymerase [Caudoviricetes sp.]